MPEACEIMISATVGIDVSKDRLDVVLRQVEREQPRGYANSALGYSDLHRWLLGQGVAPQQTQVALEATGSYSDAVALYLYEQGYVVSVLNPAVLVDYRKSVNMRSKTDTLDARLLARYAHEQRPRAWKPLPPEMRTLRYLVARREDLQQMLQQERNRLHAGRMDSWDPHACPAACQAVGPRVASHLEAHHGPSQGASLPQGPLATLADHQGHWTHKRCRHSG